MKKGVAYNLLQKSYESSLAYHQAILDAYQKLGSNLSNGTLSINMAIISPPFAPDVPVAPKKKLIVAVAGVLGLFVGVIAVFLMDFWKRSRQTLEKE